MGRRLGAIGDLPADVGVSGKIKKSNSGPSGRRAAGGPWRKAKKETGQKSNEPTEGDKSSAITIATRSQTGNCADLLFSRLTWH
ncbi:hypothetical protein PoB_007030400 [Plakobranchus ocellatus]|uniref:Uncharacterized protein n=1 Tax=Plakobranchus ocellatus TaxID=259542 RepID=A0AAV4DIE9_9GAST|nr:hypothetical protein PoB_007030400 [Plakobranchus ocellatus]